MMGKTYRKVVVGIPTIANETGYRELLADLRLQRFIEVDLVVVANSPEARNYVERNYFPSDHLLGGLVNILVDLPDDGKNLGVAASWNRIARRAFASGHNSVILINDDIRILHDEAIRDFADRFGIDWEANGILLSEHRFSYFALSKHAFEKVGPFDENFWPAYYEDIDYVRRCRLAKVPIWKTPAATGTSHNPRTSARSSAIGNMLADAVRKNRAYYVRKWGGDQGSERWDGSL